jgi:hypothetical protein
MKYYMCILKSLTADKYYIGSSGFCTNNREKIKELEIKEDDYKGRNKTIMCVEPKIK